MDLYFVAGTAQGIAHICFTLQNDCMVQLALFLRICLLLNQALHQNTGPTTDQLKVFIKFGKLWLLMGTVKKATLRQVHCLALWIGGWPSPHLGTVKSSLIPSTHRAELSLAYKRCPSNILFLYSHKKEKEWLRNSGQAISPSISLEECTGQKSQDCIYILTLGQHEFELCGSIYKPVFSINILGKFWKSMTIWKTYK